MYKLGVDIGGTKFNLGLVDKSKKIVVQHSEKVPENKDWKFVLSHIYTTLQDVLAKNNISQSEIISCGMGVPGTVDETMRIAVKVPNLGWENASVADEFERISGLPTTIVQDSRAAAWGEYVAGRGQGKNLVVCVTIGTGIGTGIVADGKIFNGALGGSGELGHIPAVKNGRPCGCGQKGCLENYVAGKGLGITATEVFGDGASSLDIFNKAKEGDTKAVEILNQAIEMLGNAMVATLNLVSPDCLLFSGGISRQTELFVEPLIQYIKAHSYSVTAENIYMDAAALGEDAPLVGAALVPQSGKNPLRTDDGARTPKIAASVMCADMLNLDADLKMMEQAGIEYLHFDLMDGHFVPNLMIPLEMLDRIRSATNIPYDIHLMTYNPENLIPKMKLQKDDIVSVHYESTPHVQRVLTLINETGASAALALNPSTPIECAREVLDDIKMLLLMTVNPGFAGQKIVPQSFDKIARARKWLDDLGYHHIQIQVDGNCSFENVPKMHKAGANIFVAGTSSVFHKDMDILSATAKLRNLIEERQEN